MHMYCGLSVKINTWEMPRKDYGRILFAFVSTCVVGKNSKTLNWSSMTDDAITQSVIGVLGSLFYIYVVTTQLINCVVTVLQAVVNSDYSVTVQSQITF